MTVALFTKKVLSFEEILGHINVEDDEGTSADAKTNPGWTGTESNSYQLFFACVTSCG